LNKHALLGSVVLAGFALWQVDGLAQIAGSTMQLAQQGPDQSKQPPGKDAKPPPGAKPPATPPPAAAKPVTPPPTALPHTGPQGTPGQAQTPSAPSQPHTPAPGAPTQQHQPATGQTAPTLQHQQTPGVAAPTPPHQPTPGQVPPAAAQGQQPTPGQGPAPAIRTPATPGQAQTPPTPGQPGTGQPHSPMQAAPVQSRPTTPGQPPASAAQLPGGVRPGGSIGALPPPPPAAQGQAPKPVALVGNAAPAPVGAGGQPLRHVDQIRKERKVEVVGGRTIIREPDRTIIRQNGQTIIQHSEVDRFTYNARNVTTQRQGDNNLTIVVRPDGIQIVTVVDLNGHLVRRVRRDLQGREIILIDNRPGPDWRPDNFYVELRPPVIRIPRERYVLETTGAIVSDIFAVLAEPPVEELERRYSLDEIRYSDSLRDRMPHIDIDSVNFESGSWEVTPDQVDRLAPLAESINRLIARNPGESFLIEGYTDAVGSDDDNLSLSDRRAESVAVVLTNQFQVPPENLSSQGYGKQFLKIPTDGPERRNRRVAIRRITPLLMGQN
jgi:outer membrane protein OmpA-like peptidoglycan-associated protein